MITNDQQEQQVIKYVSQYREVKGMFAESHMLLLGRCWRAQLLPDVGVKDKPKVSTQLHGLTTLRQDGVGEQASFPGKRSRW